MSLELLEAGTLSKPGPVGRTFRLLFGTLCLYGLLEVVQVAAYIIADPVRALPELSFLILVVLFILNYVINIGFSKDWNRYPVIVSVIFFGVVALGGYLVTGAPGTSVLGISLLVWLVYFYAHLGIAFVLAALLATPGCEMRSIPELYGKITGKGSKEHHCPSSVISGIDKWEAKRSAN